jgi:outer membrane protein assembly factor BamB
MVFGRLLVMDEAKVYGYGREKVDWSNQLQDGAYRLFAVNRADGAKQWAKPVPIRVRAMVLADEALFVAGPPAEVADPTKIPDPSQGALLIALSASDGAELGRCQLDSAPVFDGLAAVNGRLYLTTTDSKVLCLAGEK